MCANIFRTFLSCVTRIPTRASFVLKEKCKYQEARSAARGEQSRQRVNSNEKEMSVLQRSECWFLPRYSPKTCEYSCFSQDERESLSEWDWSDATGMLALYKANSRSGYTAVTRLSDEQQPVQTSSGTWLKAERLRRFNLKILEQKKTCSRLMWR